MPRKRTAPSTIRLAAEDMPLLRKLLHRFKTAKKKPNATQGDLVHWLLDMAETHDLINEGWMDRLDAALEKGMWHIAQQKRFENKKACQGLRGADNKWKCIQGRYQNTPAIRILAEDYDDALNLCEGCVITLEPILLNYELQGKIQQLESNLEAAAGVTFKAPVCNRGAVLTAEGTEFRSCPKRPSAKTVSVQKFCKVLSNGLPCQLYAEVPISVADRESQIDTDFK